MEEVHAHITRVEKGKCLRVVPAVSDRASISSLPHNPVFLPYSPLVFLPLLQLATSFGENSLLMLALEVAMVYIP